MYEILELVRVGLNSTNLERIQIMDMENSLGEGRLLICLGTLSPHDLISEHAAIVVGGASIVLMVPIKDGKLEHWQSPHLKNY